VCDLYHYYERTGVPRTLHDAFRSYGNIEEVLRIHSPVHQVNRMPKIDYMLVHGAKDQAVSKAHHSDKFCKEMTQAGHRIIYRELLTHSHG